jgi:hypothetical protein
VVKLTFRVPIFVFRFEIPSEHLLFYIAERLIDFIWGFLVFWFFGFLGMLVCRC